MGGPQAKRFFNTCSCCNTIPAVSAGVDRRNVLSGMIAAGVSAQLITHAMPALAQPAAALTASSHRRSSSHRAAVLPRGKPGASRWSEKANQSRMDGLGAEEGSRRDG